MMRCTIWYHLFNLKKLKNTHGGVLILVQLQAEACNFTKINTPPWVFSRFLNCTKSTKSRNASHFMLQEIPHYFFPQTLPMHMHLQDACIKKKQILGFCTFIEACSIRS